MERPKTSSNPATRRIHPAQKVSIKFTQYIPAYQNKALSNILYSWVHSVHPYSFSKFESIFVMVCLPL